MAGISLQLLGPPVLVPSSSPARSVSGGGKLLALLAYLALETGAHTREELATLLWGESSDAAARAALRQTLHRLRALVGEALRTDHGSVELADAVECDVRTFLRTVEQQPERAADYDVGRFLSGLSLRGAPEFEEWAARKRLTLLQRQHEALRRLATAAMDRSHWGEAARWGDRWLDCDPLSEDAARVTIESRYLAGDRSGALDRWQAFRERVRQELGVDPGVGLTTLAERMAAGTGMPRRARPPQEVTTPSFEVGLVGRDVPWSILQDLWRAVCDGTGRVAVIQGEAGVGKTRLAEDFRQWARLQGATVMRGRGYDPAAGPPYGPVIEALRDVGDAPGLAGADPEWLAEVARLLPELRRRFPNLPSPSATGERWRLFEAVAQLFLALAAERPLVLLVDDAQWCDAETAALLHFLSRRIESAAIALLLTVTLGELGREAPAARLTRALRAEPHGVTVALAPLTEEDVWRLVHDLGHLSTPSGGRRLAHRLHEATDGNPFYVMELIKTLFAQGLLAVDPVTGEWRATEHMPAADASLELPVTVRDAISQRLEDLPYELRDLLTTVAVAGRGAGTELLSHVHGVSRLRAAAQADALVERRLLVEEQGTYRCAHSMIAEVVRDVLTPARRREVDRAIALCLETTAAAAATSEVAGDIARHAERGGERGLAYRYARAASDFAVARFAYDEALTWLDLAAGVAESGAQTDEVNRCTAEVLQLAGWSEVPPSARRPSQGRRIERRDLDVGTESAEGDA